MPKLIPRNVWLVVGVMDHGAPTWRGLYWHYHANKVEAVRELRANRAQWPDEPHRMVKYVLDEEK